MSEYIDRQALLDAIPNIEDDKQISLYGAVADFIVKVDAIPAADVAPVVHGEWVTIDGISRCSECEYIPAYDSAIDDLFYSPFCPNCGAKMDGEELQNNE